MELTLKTKQAGSVLLLTTLVLIGYQSHRLSVSLSPGTTYSASVMPEDGPNQSIVAFASDSTNRPEENRFTKTVLSNDLNEPMELAVAPDGRVFFVERAGKLYMYDPATKKTRLLHDFPVKAVEKYLNGLLGMTIDPDFTKNSYLYFFYTTTEKEQTKQLISRFTLTADNNLDLTSEKRIIEVPIDLEVSAHTGGSLAWDTHHNLYISTGDNTVPFESNGFAPIDQQPGRLTFDAERSAGNPNDLRGKILRITVAADGSYTIPEGNLFPKGTPGTRPEIYVMGCRNPYRISVDPATDIVYWGEIGPDSGTDGPQGPRGYDEFNQAKKAGNFGWPYFVGDSKPYYTYDFATKTAGPLFDVYAPVNQSPNNTGIKTLPPAQKAMIWYPYNKSTEYPELGTGGRCAIGGPVYHFNPSQKSAKKLPAYYDKAVFVGDWMRNWVFALRFDENQNYTGMEPFMPMGGNFKRPVDMEFGADGVLYMLEYGSVYGIDNADARLVKIEFNPGNRAPVARISARDSIGLVPLTVAFSGQNSYDFDMGDNLKYQWQFVGGKPGSTEKTPTFTFTKNGVYKVVLTVTDPAGQRGRDTIDVKVGNTVPQVAIKTTTNSTFFFADQTPLIYTVDVQDKEDKVIDKKKVKVALNYIPKVADAEQAMGHQTITASYNLGKNLMAASDCKACHQINGKSVGPAYVEVSKRYKNDPTAVAKLANKVITGGNGNWGEHAMSAHPQLSREEATEIVKYVLSLSYIQPDAQLPAQGTLQLKDHVGKNERGRYILTASYTDNGGAITPLSQQQTLILRPSRMMGADATDLHNIERQGRRLTNIHDQSYFVYKNIDLTAIKQLTYRFAAKDQDATMEVHTDSPTGPVVSTLICPVTGETYAERTAPVQPTVGKHDLYFVFVKKDAPAAASLASLEWVDFGK